MATPDAKSRVSFPLPAPAAKTMLFEVGELTATHVIVSRLVEGAGHDTTPLAHVTHRVSNDEIRLIEVVKRYNVLYDLTATDYKDHTVRDAAWEQVAAQLEITSKITIS
ncbi:hypothetical protein LSTR_LSTR017660 [Laodelphax striatellus]|uniref:MADF domain-containing protein n=1 Tax=Laodelphax striatellus TaxID=195883 RepID=A0A482WKP6_LAOST|nr:hypothetical protein LSTR_LSTR017660 [Laodelphax striatellus]